MQDTRAGSDPIAPLRATLGRRYEIQRELGQGAFATVYLAHDLRHERQVAIKVLRVDPSTDLPEMRFLREIRLLARLQHPNILPLHDSGHVLDLLYYVMPYVAGESLRERIARERRLDVGVALCIAREVAEALAYAHRAGVIHRDIKPENILLSGGRPMIADFGIARAVDSGRVRQLTQTGLGSPGTPAYMSPEQMLGEHDIDGRSDVYSLCCVLYEMLAGEPPFSGASGFAKRFTEPPPSICGVRRGVPQRVDDAIRTGLAHDPADRFRTAEELAEVLARGEAELPGRHKPASGAVTSFAPPAGIAETPASPKPSPPPPVEAPTGLPWRMRATTSLRRRWWVAAPVLLLGLGGALLLPAIRGPLESADLSTSTYVVLPFAERSPDAAEPLDGAGAQRMLDDALTSWRELNHVGTLTVNDAVARHGRPGTLDRAIDIARGLGAGVLAWGELARYGDTLEVRAALYDVARAGAPIREHTLRIPVSASDLRVRFSALADSLLLGGPTVPPLEGGAPATRSLAAMRAYERAHEALMSWDLRGAEEEFRAASRLDPDFPQPHLWLAQIMAWTDAGYADRQAWRSVAARALTRRAALTDRDATLAAALHALASTRYPDACRFSRDLLARDTLDFSAWYVLAECNGRDPIVQPDASSPSGWSFRGSYHTAVDAYRRAFELIPSFHLALGDRALARMQHLLFTEPTRVRLGTSATPDSARFAAYPGLHDDTLAFVPYPVAAFQASAPGVQPPSFAVAIGRNRQILKQIAKSWVSAFPRSPDAHAVLSRALEATGEIGGRGGAAAELRLARSLAADPIQQLRLARAEVRLLLKLEDFAGAQALADSLLRLPRRAGSDAAQVLAPLALLTGRAHDAVEMLRLQAHRDTLYLPDGQPFVPPQPLAEAELALLGYAAIGGPVDSIRVVRERVERLVRSYVPPNRRAATQAALFSRSMPLAFPLLGAPSVRGLETGRNSLLNMQQRLAATDTGAVREGLAILRRIRGSGLPGWTTIDATFCEAALYLALGDTAAATEQLDLSLDALPALGASVLEQAPESGALIRAMALRAELALRARDFPTARRWARAVATLWVGADAELQPTVASMRAMIAAAG